MADQDVIDVFAFQEAILGRYSLDREIGRGGMGVVYLAHEVALDRPVALKVMPPAMAAQPALRERFLREARTAAKLSHPNIVPIHAVAEVDDFVFFAMAYVEGATLGERVRDRGPLVPKEAVRILQEVAWALAYAHAEGVVHRDVKPDNILLDQGTGRALVTDFGIAHLRKEQSVTGSGEVLGTAEYMSPEQASGEDIGPASDIYSLGVVGYYAVTGKLPFEGSTVAAVLAKHLTLPAPPVASVAPEVPSSLANAIDRSLEKKPVDRFENVGSMAEALSQGVALQRELPVPLRIFVRSMRDFASATPLVGLLWLVVALLPFIVAEEFAAWPVTILVVLGTITVAPLFALSLYARRLLGAGYTLEDGRLALNEDSDRRLEEIRFEFGKGLTWVDKALRSASAAGIVFAMSGIVAEIVWSVDLSMAISTSMLVGIYSGFTAAARNKRRRDWISDIATALSNSTFGKWAFSIGKIGLKRGAVSAGGAHRPTEMAISIAADRLFEELPRELRQELAGLPEAIEKLEADAANMRSEVERLSGVLAEIGRDAGHVESEEREKLRADIEATQGDAKTRMTQAISALEKIRLGLLRLHAGDGSVESLTMELGSAREVSTAIDRLLEGQSDVARFLSPPSLMTDP